MIQNCVFSVSFHRKSQLKSPFCITHCTFQDDTVPPPAGRREKRRQGKVHDKEDLCNFAPPQNIGHKKQYTYIYK